MQDDRPETSHLVQFYEDDAFLADAVATFLADGLAAGGGAIVIATADHRDAITARLAARGIALAAARAAGRWVELDAAETLARFMRDGAPDRERFEEVAAAALARAGDGGRRPVRAFGEMVALLWSTGRREAALALETLWNGLGRRVAFTLLCGYPVSAFDREDDRPSFGRVCDVHATVLPAEPFATLTTDDERRRAVSSLQQTATALAAENFERRRTERRLVDEMADFVEHAPVAIHAVDRDGIILWANDAELRMLGYARDEYFGRHVAEFHADQDVIADLLRRLASGDAVSGQRVRLRRKSGAIRHAVLDSNALRRDGEIVYTRCFTRDVTDVVDADLAGARLAALVESCDDAIVAKTLEGIVTSWNAAAERLFGYTSDEMIGQPISRIIPPERLSDFPRILDAVRRGDRIDHFETERVRKDGRRIFVSLTVSPIRDSTGRIVGASKIARDVTDRKRVDAEREHLLRMAEHARAEAEAANRSKDEFLAMLSHELRNPLSAIRNAVVAASLDEGQRTRALAIARRQTDQLARLVDDLLEMSRITEGRIFLRREHVSLAEVVGRAVETTRSVVEDHGHVLTVAAADEVRVDGDPVRLEQMIVNLITNAAKYTEPGGRIEVSIRRDGTDAELAVRDNGMGIAPEMLTRVFELFAQAERGLDRAQGGLGIGLTVVRRLVELHGGRVEAHSDGPGRGAEFVVRLPALAAVRDRGVAARPADDVRSGPRARVLVVEDNPDAAEGLALLLGILGHRVRVVHDGIAALDVAPANPPDVMLVDIGLPGMDGYELARRVRSHPDLRDVVLVALTGYGREEDRRRAFEAGFDYHLVKPVDTDALEGLVSRLVRSEPGPTARSTVH